MKIIMFAPKFYPYIGGVEKHILRVSEELIKKGHDITVVTTRQDLDVPIFGKLGEISIYRIPSLRCIDIWMWLFENRHIISQADIIHCHDYSTFILWYLPFRLLYHEKPTYITFHGYEGKIPIPRKTLFLRKLTEWLTLGNICIGDFIPKWYATKATTVLYGGVDLPRETKDGNVIQNRFNSGVYVGRLENDTGILEYLEALKILKYEYNLSLEGYICGDGALRTIVQQELCVNKINFRVLGFVRMPETYFKDSQFAFVSGYLGILEAMAHRKLVFNIATNALRDDYLRLIPNAENIMVTANSPRDLAEKFFYFFSHPKEAEKLISEAYLFAQERSWESVADAYLSLWQKSNTTSYS